MHGNMLERKKRRVPHNFPRAKRLGMLGKSSGHDSLHKAKQL